jgi:hypothetical protein
MSAASPYPVRVEGRLDPGLSRWLWLVKWILAIPHYIVLFFLLVAYLVVTVIAFFAILITGRYPRALFDFNVGVLRWAWRVGFYTFDANGTDRYPPFTLARTDYPADFDVEYPERFSRGLVLIQWWLLALPQYLVIGFFNGGDLGFGASTDIGNNFNYAGGLIFLFVVYASVALLFTNRYPSGLFDLVVGLNRWTFRVIAYGTLLTQNYPPFRFDGGPTEPPALPTEAMAAAPRDEPGPAGVPATG